MILNRIPKKWFTRVRHDIDHTSSIEALVQLMDQIKMDIGADYYSFGSYFEFLDRNKDVVFILSDTPQAWQKKYKAEGLVHNDACIIKARKTSIPFMWDDVDDTVFLKKASQYQLNYGISFPVHGPRGSFGFLFFMYEIKPSKMSSRFEHIVPYLQIIAIQLIAALRRLSQYVTIFSKHKCSTNVSLSKRQRECLIWAAEGKTSEEIALILNLSSSMVVRHLENAGEKLHSENRIQCVAKAVDQKLIALEHKKKPFVFYLGK